MLQQQRHETILSILAENGTVHTADLVKRMEVSSETIRKDLDYLEKVGQLTRVHGGAVPASEKEPTFAPDYITLSTRKTQNVEQKKAIVQYALSMVEENQVIALDYGSTSQLMASALKGRFRKLSIITNSIQNALLLSEAPEYTIILTGGILNKNEYTIVDPLTSLMDNLHIDTYFMSVSGIDPIIGCTDLGFSEANVQNQMRHAARRTVVYADSSKFGRASLVKVCPIEEIDCIITDQGLSEEMKDSFVKRGANLIVV